MTDLNAKVIADLKRELAEAKAAADAVTESMGSEIMRLHGEIEQQRTRAEAAEQERRAEWERGKSAWDDGYAKSLARAKGAESELLAVRRQLSDLVSATNGFVGAYDEHGAFDGLLVGEDSWMTAMRDALREAKSRPHPVDPQDQLAAARKALEGVDVEALLHGEIEQQRTEITSLRGILSTWLEWGGHCSGCEFVRQRANNPELDPALFADYCDCGWYLANKAMGVVK